MRGTAFLVAGIVGCGAQVPPAPPSPAGAPVPGPALSRPAPRGRDVPPLARRADVVEVHHGMRVVDPYRWMETPSPERDTWLTAQNAHARRVLASLPERDALRDRLRHANREVEQVQVFRVTGDQPRLFALRRRANDESAVLVVRDGWDGPERVLVNPADRGQPGTHASIDEVYPSPDGRHAAYVVAEAGREDGTIEIVEVETGRILPDRIDRTQLPSISWRPDGRSFFYNRRAKPRPGAAPSDWFKDSAAFLHQLGSDPDAAPPILAASTPRLGLGSHAAPWARATPRSRWVLGEVMQGVNQFSFFLAPLDRVKPGATSWRPIAAVKDQVLSMLVHGDRLFAFTHSDAPNYRIVSFGARSQTIADATDFVPASDLVLVEFAAARDAMYVVALDGGIHRLFRVDWRSAARAEISLPFAGSVGKLVTEPDRPGLVFSLEGRARPRGWYRFDASSGVRELQLSPPRKVDGFVVDEAIAISRDGTEVPLSIVRRADQALDGTAPALLSGYGAYGFPTSPRYDPFALTWVARGAVHAVCHVRGSGARGKSWHLDGIKQKKENGVDDYIACAEYLIQRRYTASRRLIATGGSAGGIVVGGAITKRPDLFTAAVLRVAVVNLVRHEVSATGPGNVPEYGSLAVESEFHSMLASDPYHRIRDGVRYPAVLLTTGLNDPRVPAWEPAKFAARLQAASRERPILLRIESDAGHGIGSTATQREEESADIFTFALWQAGILRQER